MRFLLLFSVLAILLAFPLAITAQEDEDWAGPRFELDDLDGDELTEEDVFTDGELYLIDFWASWCRPCSQYLPHLREMIGEYGERGFRVVIFCVDDAGSISTARTLLAAEDYPFTILFDPASEVKDALGVRRIPTTVLLDPAGEELWRHVGYSSGDEEEVREQVESNLPCEEADEESDEDE